MEMMYSNFKLDDETFGRNELIGLIDINSNFVYNRVYDTRSFPINYNNSVHKFLKPCKGRKKLLLEDMMSQMELPSDILKRKLRTLSSGELTKVLAIKYALSPAPVVILEYIDTKLNYRDLENILIAIKKNIDELHKIVIFTSSKIDNVVNLCTRYIIAKDGHITYNGNSVDELPLKTKIANFVDLANKKKAKLIYYKEESDLLKAIYRSIKK